MVSISGPEFGLVKACFSGFLLSNPARPDRNILVRCTDDDFHKNRNSLLPLQAEMKRMTPRPSKGLRIRAIVDDKCVNSLARRVCFCDESTAMTSAGIKTESSSAKYFALKGGIRVDHARVYRVFFRDMAIGELDVEELQFKAARRVVLP